MGTCVCINGPIKPFNLTCFNCNGERELVGMVRVKTNERQSVFLFVCYSFFFFFCMFLFFVVVVVVLMVKPRVITIYPPLPPTTSKAVFLKGQFHYI